MSEKEEKRTDNDIMEDSGKFGQQVPQDVRTPQDVQMPQNAQTLPGPQNPGGQVPGGMPGPGHYGYQNPYQNNWQNQRYYGNDYSRRGGTITQTRITAMFLREVPMADRAAIRREITIRREALPLWGMREAAAEIRRNPAQGRKCCLRCVSSLFWPSVWVLSGLRYTCGEAGRRRRCSRRPLSRKIPR